MDKINKKGGAFLTILVAVAFFMFGILIVGLIMPDISVARSVSVLDCTNSSITNGEKVACLGVDGVVPAFIISLVLIGGGAVVLKLVS